MPISTRRQYSFLLWGDISIGSSEIALVKATPETVGGGTWRHRGQGLPEPTEVSLRALRRWLLLPCTTYTIIVGKRLQHLIPYRLGVRAIFYALLALYPNTLL